MKRIIHKMRLQPPEFRIMIAVIGAVIMTGIIGSLWARSLSVETFQTEKTDTTPGPLNVLVSNIKNAFDAPQEEVLTPITGNKIQVIDSGQQYQFDESNPASATTTQ